MSNLLAYSASAECWRAYRAMHRHSVRVSKRTGVAMAAVVLTSKVYGGKEAGEETG